MDTSNSDVEQTNCALDLVLEFTANKEVQTWFDDIKMFRTIGTQTEHFHVQRNPSMHPDDINKLHHLEDHSYSLGPNTEHVKDENIEIVEPCPIPCMPDFKEQMPLLDPGDVQNEVIVESIDTQVPCCTKADDSDVEPSIEDDACLSESSYCPSSSDDDSEKDDEHPSATVSGKKNL